MMTSDMFTSQLSSTQELGVVREDVSTRTVTEPLNTDDTSPVPGDPLRKPEPARHVASSGRPTPQTGTGTTTGGPAGQNRRTARLFRFYRFRRICRFCPRERVRDKVNGIGEISHPPPPRKPLDQFGCRFKYITTRDVHGNGIPIPTGFPWEWEHKYAKNGNGNGKKSTCDNGNGNGYFFMCAKIPIGRLDANASQ